MPGIVGYCSTQEARAFDEAKLSKMVEAISHEVWYETASAKSSRGVFACVHLGHFNHHIVATNDDAQVGVMLDGWVFAASSKDDSRFCAARYCLNQYLKQGIDFVKNLNGQFNLIVWDERDGGAVFLVNDRYGLRPMQYAESNGNLYFAPEGKAIFASGAVEAKLNRQALVNLLSYGRIWIGRDTFFENIKMLPPASILAWQDGRTQLHRYWDYAYQAEANIDDDFVAHAVETFRRAVARSTEPRLRYGVSLSGGLDSRAVLAALSQTNGVEFQTYSWGVGGDHDEVQIARRTAETLKAKWQFVPLAPADFISNAGRGVYLTEGLDLLVQSQGLKIYPTMRQGCDAALTGLALDLTLGGTYLSPALVEESISSDDAFASLLKQSSVFSNDECRALLRDADTTERIDALRRQASEDWNEDTNARLADKCDRFFLHARVWRYTFTRQFWQRMFIEDCTPTFDNEFIDCILRLPPEWRAGHRFYKLFLQKLDGRMMDIPYQRTLLPPAAPLEFWKQGARLEEQKEELYRRIWHETNGAVFVPYKRYSTNYDEWLRHDADWIATTDELLGANSVLCERYAEPAEVAKLIAQHRSGERANHKKILQLMTLELFLRKFFN